MLRPILVPLDGSALDERALGYAAPLAESMGTPLHLVRAVAPASPVYYSRAETLSFAVARQREDRLNAQAALARTASRLRRRGHAVHTHIRFGRPSDVILETAREQGVGLVVLATRGRRGLARWWEGSVADEVARWADVPVLLVRAGDRRGWPTDRPARLMIALDGSAFAEAVLEPASELAEALAADVLLARVVPPPSLLEEARATRKRAEEQELAAARAYLDRIATGLHLTGRVSTQVAAATPPAVTLERIAREERVDLVALATHGRGGFARLAAGSVATALLERSPVPLLVVRPATAPTLAAAEIGMTGSGVQANTLGLTM